ncbi:MAG: hypothetical protein RIC55_27410 [Pirellulaceae bacterium]
MPEMNPYYAHPSPVGDVFDVAAWSPAKTFGMGLTGIVLATLVGVAAACIWDPGLMKEYLPDLAKDLARENAKLTKAYPWAIPAIVGGLGCLTYVFLAAGVTFAGDALRSNCYFRAGPGGMSLRLPHGVSWAQLGFGSKVVELHVPWAEIKRWTITQHKRLGSLSPNAGNLNAHFDLTLRNGRSFHFSLDTFREPARIIYSRIEESQEMTTALLTPSASHAEVPPTQSEARTYAGDARQSAVHTALVNLLEQPTNGAAVLFSDTSTGRFVQFVQLNGALLLDLPLQSLRGDEKQRAGEYFQKLSQNAASESSGGAPAKTALSAVATSRSYQINFAQDAQHAADVTLELFREVLGVAEGFQLEVEQF